MYGDPHIRQSESPEHNLNSPSDWLAQQVAALADACLSRDLQLATAESCTGGGIAAALTSRAGSSRWFDGGWVTYSNAAKQRELGVPETLLETVGAVSEPVVRAMAEGARHRAGVAWAAAVSGIAGPDGGTPEKPVGLVWMAWAGPQGTISESRVWPGDRSAVRQQTIAHVLHRWTTLISTGETPDPVP